VLSQGPSAGIRLDRLVAHGDTPFAVHEIPIGRIDMAIRYDIRFPEPVRLLALEGADIIAFPSNWPVVERVAPPPRSRRS
jgi:predicted amidohydrolase